MPGSFSDILTYSITFLVLPLAALYCSRRTMASILRSIVAGPRLQHEEAGLDLCYVHATKPTLIAMSMPAVAFPKKAYRNPLSDVVAYLNRKHGDAWSIWEFRAEGTGYGDDEVDGRIFHAPFPDHHPPPFALLPLILASMRNHLHSREDAVAVVHCKAGKGRSGTVCCSYLIAEEGWSKEDALARFTAARMRPGFGEGVSIPSQRRWIGYVERWTREFGKRYMERRVRIKELHVWGLRPGVRVAVQGFVDEGKNINTFHTFSKAEKTIVDSTETGDAVIYRPQNPLILPTSDVNIDFEKRSKAAYDWTMVTSIAHVWFNVFFEGGKVYNSEASSNAGSNSNSNADTPADTPAGSESPVDDIHDMIADSGVFEIEWKAMDGIKGTSRKGVQAFEKLAVVWEVVKEGEVEIDEPLEGEIVQLPRKATTKPLEERDLGLQKGSPGSSTSRVGTPSSSEVEEARAAEEAAVAEDTAASRPAGEEQGKLGEGERLVSPITAEEVDSASAGAGKGKEGPGTTKGERMILSGTLENPTAEEPYFVKESKFGSLKRKKNKKDKA